MLNRCDQPFLIVGCGSSGSHLLSIMLDTHPLVVCGPELSVFNKAEVYRHASDFRERFPGWLARGARVDGWLNYREFMTNREHYFWDDAHLEQMVNAADSLRDLSDRFFAPILEKRQKQIWGEQTLSNAYCIAEFLALYPKARIIHLVRDGRDVMRSLMRRGATDYRAAARWLFDTAVCCAHRGRDYYLEVRYEDLVAVPVPTLQRVCAHVGIDFQEQMLRSDSNEYWAGIVSDGKVHQTWNNRPTSGRISSSSVGRWKGELTPQQIELFWSIELSERARRAAGVSFRDSRELMTSFGYGDVPPRRAVTPRRYWHQAAFAWGERAVLELALHGRLWLPLTRPTLF